jgi:glycosyltransferase involved in cell wall biosynthesis
VQAYLNSDLFVFASNVEYSPLVLFEAAAAGLPFLSVPVGNAEEIARWTGGGEICPAPRDAQGYTRVEPRVLAERMQVLAADREKLKRMGEAGRRSWLERFTWAKIADQYEALFERVSAEKSTQSTELRREHPEDC